MKYLMHFCTNWKGSGCNPAVEEQGYAKEIKNGEDIPLMPFGEEQDKLDEICKDCKSGSFFSKEERCPVCDSTEVENTGISEDIPGQVKEYKYKCSNENCGRYFWISEVDLRS